MTSLSHHQLHVWIDYIGDIITWLISFLLSTLALTGLAFLKNMIEKCKSTSLIAIQVENWC